MFSDKLKKLREEKDLTQRELAKLLNMSCGAIGLYETGKREPDFKILQKIATFFGVSVDYLLTGKESTEEVDYSPLENFIREYKALGKEDRKKAAEELFRLILEGEDNKKK